MSNPAPTATAAQTWYVVNKKEDSDATAEILIYDEIGAFGITAKQFITDLRAITAERIIVRLNSPGGEIFEANAIFSALKGHGADIDVRIEGLAASAGSFIAMAGDKVRMASNAYMMIHNAQGGVMGDANDIHGYAELLDKLNDTIAGMYEGRAGKDRKHWRALMDVETWFTADEAKEAGLVDEVYEAGAVLNAQNGAKYMAIYNKVPDAVRARFMATQITNPPEAAPRGDASRVVSQQENNMADAIETPATVTPPTAGTTGTQPGKVDPLRAQEIQGYVEQGRGAGIEQGRKDERDRCKAIVDACPGKPQMAMTAFLSGQSPEAVKLAYEAAAAAESAAEVRIAELQEENRRQVALAAAGGYAGGVSFSPTNETDEMTGPMTAEAAKASAGREWDRQPNVRKGFSSKDNYVSIRTAELRGQYRGARASA